MNATDTQDAILLTPGPLTTSMSTRTAMLHDWGSWDDAFIALTASVCRDLVEIVDGRDSHVCVPLQGSGTFAVEAALATLVPGKGRVLVPDNGAYCKRIVRILECLGRAAVVLAHGEADPADPARIDAALAADPGITHVAQVHCETGTGILNPLAEIAAVVASPRTQADRGRDEFVRRDASQHCEPRIRCADCGVRQMPGRRAGHGVRHRAAAAIEGVGRQQRLAGAGSSRPVAYMQKTGQWRFTPPTHVLARCAALDSTAPGRPAGAARALCGQLRGAGRRHARARLQTFFRCLQAPIIVTFPAADDPGTISGNSTAAYATRATFSIPAS